MKKETEPSEFICDNTCHSKEQPAFGQLSIHFWYGSQFDMKQGTVHLCDECAKNMMFLLKKEFGLKENFLKPIIEL